jgi:hypothetical protein
MGGIESEAAFHLHRKQRSEIEPPVQTSDTLNSQSDGSPGESRKLKIA